MRRGRGAASIVVALAIAFALGGDGARAATPALALASLDRRIADIDAEQGTDKREIEAIGARIAELHARIISRGRAFYRATRAGMLPVGGGFEAFIEHAMKVERMRRGLAADLAGERDLRAHAADLARAVDRLDHDRLALATQRTALDQERALQEEETRRQQAFDRAFSTSTGAAEYVPVAGGSDDDEVVAGFAASRGRLLFPVSGSAETRPARREGTGGPGLEIRAAYGSVVRAVFAGRIAFADRYGPYGKIVIVDHGAHYYSVSGNLGEIDVRVGDQITPGQRLGTVGDDGQGAMLYFEIRHGADTVPPGPWLGLP